MQRFLAGITEVVVGGHGWKKFVNPTEVTRGSTAWPHDSGEQEKHGVRYDYDGEMAIEGTVYHKFQMQANAGNKIPRVETRATSRPLSTSSGCLVVLSMYTPLAQMPFVEYVGYVLVSRLSLHRCLNVTLECCG